MCTLRLDEPEMRSRGDFKTRKRTAEVSRRQEFLEEQQACQVIRRSARIEAQGPSCSSWAQSANNPNDDSTSDEEEWNTAYMDDEVLTMMTMMKCLIIPSLIQAIWPKEESTTISRRNPQKLQVYYRAQS